MVRVLLEYGANVSAEDLSGRTPLHGAASRGHTNGAAILPVGLLLEHGADVSARDEAGCTPLHRALLAHGDVNPVRDNETVAQMLLDNVHPGP